MATVALVATLAGGGSAAANWGSGGVAGGHLGIAAETALAPLLITAPLMELPNGCGDDWSFEDSID